MFKVCNRPSGQRQPVIGLLGRKRKGNLIGSAICSLIIILAIILLIFGYLDLVKVFDIKEDVKQASREYMLRMETVGYLTPEDAAALTNRLQSLGVTDIDLTGSTTGGPAGYGNRIKLVISCSIPGESLDINSDILNAVFRDTSYPVTVVRESTAKY